MSSPRLLYGGSLVGLVLLLVGLVLFTTQESSAVLIAGLVLLTAGGVSATLALPRLLARSPWESELRTWASEPPSELGLPGGRDDPGAAARRYSHADVAENPERQAEPVQRVGYLRTDESRPRLATEAARLHESHPTPSN